MEYNAGFVTSLILLPKFIFEALWRPHCVMKLALSPKDDEWDSQYPTLEFVAVVIVSVFTLSAYSAIEIGLLSPGELDIPGSLDRESNFAKAAFFGLALPISFLSLFLFYGVWLRPSHLHEKQRELQGGSAAYSLLSGQSVWYDPSGVYTPISASPLLIQIIYLAKHVFIAIAFGYFFISSYKFRKL